MIGGWQTEFALPSLPTCKVFAAGEGEDQIIVGGKKGGPIPTLALTSYQPLNLSQEENIYIF